MTPLCGSFFPQPPVRPEPEYGMPPRALRAQGGAGGGHRPINLPVTAQFGEQRWQHCLVGVGGWAWGLFPLYSHAWLLGLPPLLQRRVDHIQQHGGEAAAYPLVA